MIPTISLKSYGAIGQDDGRQNVRVRDIQRELMTGIKRFDYCLASVLLECLGVGYKTPIVLFADCECWWMYFYVLAEIFLEFEYNERH